MLDWPCPRVQHSPPHHHRFNLGNLPGDVGMQLVQDGRARAVDLGLHQEAPEAEVEGGRGQGARRPLSAPQAPSTDHCVLKLVVQIPHISTRKKGLIYRLRSSESKVCEAMHVQNHIQKDNTEPPF